MHFHAILLRTLQCNCSQHTATLEPQYPTHNIWQHVPTSHSTETAWCVLPRHVLSRILLTRVFVFVYSTERRNCEIELQRSLRTTQIATRLFSETSFNLNSAQDIPCRLKNTSMMTPTQRSDLACHLYLPIVANIVFISSEK